MGAPTPLPTGPGNPSAAAAPPPALPTSVATSDNVRTYRVREGGEYVYQIAQNVLGDRNRWPEIYRLNSNLEPSRPYPAGVDIRVPAGKAP